MGHLQRERDRQFFAARRNKIIVRAVTYTGLAALAAVTAMVTVAAVSATGWH